MMGVGWRRRALEDSVVVGEGRGGWREGVGGLIDKIVFCVYFGVGGRIGNLLMVLNRGWM